jgi:hypothetical protein
MKLTLLIMLCVLVGCTTTPTGETVMSSETVDTIDVIAGVAEPLGATAASLAFLWPPATAIGALIVGAAGAWRKMKPKIVLAENERDIAEAAGEATSYAIDEFKKAHPDAWSELSGYLRDNHGPVVESFYRALRGLPPKG